MLGKGLGKASIKKGLEIAFFQWRVPRVVAKIDARNIRSIKVFENSGFLLENEYTNMKIFSISIDDYIMKLA
jgi:regulator of nucleoside diphosphate kinase